MVRQVAKLIIRMLSKPVEPNVEDHRKAKWTGVSDASCRLGRSGTGEWLWDGTNPKQSDVYWLLEEFVTAKRDTGLFHMAEQNERMAAMELLGSLMLLNLAKNTMGPQTTFRMYVPLATDNQGNAISILNEENQTLAIVYHPDADGMVCTPAEH